MGNDKKLFAGANTAEGFVGYYDSLVDAYNLKKLYILKGGSGVGKSTFIEKFAAAFPDCDKDFLICSGDPKSLDGVIIVNKKIGIIDGTSPHMVDPAYPGVIDEIVNLGEYIIEGKVKATKEKILELSTQKKAHYKKACTELAKAREVHYQLEALYKDAVDFNKVNEKLAQVLSKHTS